MVDKCIRALDAKMVEVFKIGQRSIGLLGSDVILTGQLNEVGEACRLSHSWQDSQPAEYSSKWKSHFRHSRAHEAQPGKAHCTSNAI
jgi:hypothetical protein